MSHIDSARGKAAQTFMERMSTLTDVLDGRAGLQDLPPFTEYLSMPEGYKAPGGASQNYKSMGRFSRYVYELIVDGPELENYRRQTLNYFAEEERVGQMLTEQGASTPHGGMHVARALLARLASIIFGDAEVEAASRAWLSGFLAMCRACSNKTGRVAWPGFRVLGDPVDPVRDIVWRAAAGLPQRLPKGDKVRTDRYFIGGRLALMLAELPDGLPDPALSLPTLWAPMTVHRFRGGGYLATIEKPAGLDAKGLKQAVDWVLSVDAALEFGRSWQTPAPLPRNVVDILTSSMPF